MAKFGLKMAMLGPNEIKLGHVVETQNGQVRA